MNIARSLPRCYTNTASLTPCRRRSGRASRRDASAPSALVAYGQWPPISGAKRFVDAAEPGRGWEHGLRRLWIRRRRLIVRSFVVSVLDSPQRVESYNKGKGSHKQDYRLEHREILRLLPGARTRMVFTSGSTSCSAFASKIKYPCAPPEATMCIMMYSRALAEDSVVLSLSDND